MASRSLGFSLLVVLFVQSPNRTSDLRKPPRLVIAKHDDHTGAIGRCWSVFVAGRRTRRSAADCRLQTTPGVLPGGRDVEAVHRLRHPNRGVDAARQLERQVPGCGQWRLGGIDTYTAGSGGIERGMAEALKRGYATASTDTGHTGDTAAPVLVIPRNWWISRYRSVHEMTMTAKAILKAFYDTSPKLSYWNGCSSWRSSGTHPGPALPGGLRRHHRRRAGDLADPAGHPGAPVGQAALKEPRNVIPSSQYPMLYRAVMNACDAVDGLRDGLIGDPRRCRFDFKTIECRGEDSASCLTSGQAESRRRNSRIL